MNAFSALDRGLQDRLKALANTRNLPPEALIEDAVRDYVDRAERLAEFLYEAAQSKSEFDQTGRHLKSAAAFEWLDRWGGPDETEAPECQTLL
jgi:predicted transcriptional regulator